MVPVCFRSYRRHESLCSKVDHGCLDSAAPDPLLRSQRLRLLLLLLQWLGRRSGGEEGKIN